MSLNYLHFLQDWATKKQTIHGMNEMCAYLSLIFSRPAEGPLPSRRGMPKRKVVSMNTERTACTIIVFMSANFVPCAMSSSSPSL